MAIAPKIVYPCDHIIEDTVKQYGDIEMVRETMPGYPDKVPANIDIIRIDSVLCHNKQIEYSPYTDYEQKVSKNIIEWINPSHSPQMGQTYYIRGCYVKTQIKKYDDDKCERCGGNGWYARIFSERGANTVSLQDKLIQDFIKVLFTEKGSDGYGSSIKDIVATNAYNEVELGLQVSNIIADCENQIKKSQREHMNGGSEIDLEEQLSQIIVKDVIFVRDETTCYVNIEIINAYQQVVQFGFKI